MPTPFRWSPYKRYEFRFTRLWNFVTDEAPVDQRKRTITLWNPQKGLPRYNAGFSFDDDPPHFSSCTYVYFSKYVRPFQSSNLIHRRNRKLYPDIIFRYHLCYPKKLMKTRIRRNSFFFSVLFSFFFQLKIIIFFTYYCQTIIVIIDWLDR